MNVGTIVTPNAKGQIVIPYLVREKLGIGVDTQLQLMVSGNGIVLNVVDGVVRRGETKEQIFREILKNTAGAWGPATKEEILKERNKRKFELTASKRRRTAW